MSTIGERIKKARELRNITQSQLGEKLGVTGVTVMRYEKGQREPNIETIFNLAEKLNVSVSYLLGVVDLDGFISPDGFADPADYEFVKALGFDSPQKLATLVPGAHQSTPEHRREIERMMEKEEGYLEENAVQQMRRTREEQLLTAYGKLNDFGQAVALVDVERLSTQEKYTDSLEPRTDEERALVEEGRLAELWEKRYSGPQEPPTAPSDGRDTAPRRKRRHRAAGGQITGYNETLPTHSSPDKIKAPGRSPGTVDNIRFYGYTESNKGRYRQTVSPS